MNILLLYPKFPNWLHDFRHAIKFKNRKYLLPPVGLLTVAALLPDGWNKRLVDENVQSLTKNDLEWADYVFISAMPVHGQSVRRLTKICRQAGRKIVAGGPLFTFDWDKFNDIDHFVLNEAELTLPSFLSDLQAGCAKHVYSSTEFADIRQSPIPLWHLARLEHYEIIGIQFSRGCKFDCEYCVVSSVLGRGIRAKSVTQLIAELDSIYAAGWRRSIYFLDDNFIISKGIKKEILPALIEWRKDKQDIQFQTFVSINIADDDELMELMYDAGFDSVFIGIETPNKNTLADCNKIQNTNRNLLDCVRHIHGKGIRVYGGLMVGFDNDTPEVFQQHIDFIQQSGIAAVATNQLKACSGTRLYKRMAAEGRLLTNFIDGDNTNFIPKMGMEELKKGYEKLLRQIYAPPHYYKRVITFLSEFKRPRKQSKIELQSIIAFFLVIYHIGIRGVERNYFWRLIFWTLFKRPTLFPMAVTMAVYGYNFRKCVEEMFGDRPQEDYLCQEPGMDKIPFANTSELA
ncbi:MAG: B12-binding domain-containing radical SAM protein [Planctomycetes bacterium HGW-Planctomycetes-1]|nr:MAG: B12-binding domain-containing radical SAM protein [Planctomycetes bacterium HGW-Planctomycetes-1]